MTQGEQLVRIAGRSPSEVCRELELGEDVVAILAEDPAPTAFLTALLQGEYFADAVRYLAHAFANREGVAWACRCARRVAIDPLSDDDEAALRAAEAWVQAPDQDGSDAAGTAAEAAGLEGMASLAALAARWSGASMTAPALPAVPPAADFTARAVAGSVLLAATGGEPDDMDNRYKTCLALGIELAKG